MSHLTLLGKKEHLREAKDRVLGYCCPFTAIEDRTLDTPMLEYLFGDDFPKTIYVLDATPEELDGFFDHVLRYNY